MNKQTILVIGEVFVDTHLDIVNEENTPLVRIGGIFHSARAFAAIEADYALAYYAPEYLNDDVNNWSVFLKSKGCYKLGNIDKSPNVMLIKESTESGFQGYVNILKDQTQYREYENLETVVEKVKPTDILIFPGRYNVSSVMSCLNKYSGRVHIDINYDSEKVLKNIDRKIETIIASTSSELFTDVCNGDFSQLNNFFKSYNVEQIILKENRGGSMCYIPKTSEKFEAPAYCVNTVHSVGVGDVFDAIYITNTGNKDISYKMKYSSICAAKYAETFDFNEFKENVSNIAENDYKNNYCSVRIPWEDRKKMNIYLAAPDFPDVDTSLLDILHNSLKYHNFSPRRPIAENGLVTKELSNDEKSNLYCKDVKLMDKCDLLIATLLFNDPGTLVELGMFKQSGKPTILYDPYYICQNMFVQNTPNYLCHQLSDVIDKVYICLGGNINE